MKRTEIISKVTRVLVESLDIDEDKIELTTQMVKDLGVDSMYHLDIVLRLQREFGITIPHGELFPDGIILRDPDYVDDHGTLTAYGMAQLKEKLPFADVSLLPANMRAEETGKLFTVKWVVDYLESKLVQLA